MKFFLVFCFRAWNLWSTVNQSAPMVILIQIARVQRRKFCVYIYWTIFMRIYCVYLYWTIFMRIYCVYLYWTICMRIYCVYLYCTICMRIYCVYLYWTICMRIYCVYIGQYVCVYIMSLLTNIAYILFICPIYEREKWDRIKCISVSGN